MKQFKIFLEMGGWKIIAKLSKRNLLVGYTGESPIKKGVVENP